MSSASPNSPPKRRSPKKTESDITVLGSNWAAAVIGRVLAQTGSSVRVLQVDEPVATRPLGAITVGNGECFENARCIYGEKLAEWFWTLSESNFSRAQAYFRALSLPFGDGGAVWYAANEKEAQLLAASAARAGRFEAAPVPHGSQRFMGQWHGPGLIFDPALCEAKSKLGLDTQRISEVQIAEASAVSTELRFRRAGQPASHRTSLLLLSSEWLAPQLFPTLAEKCLPVTLSHFRFPLRGTRPAPLSFFHQGIDFAFEENGTMRLGSFRNLFEDRAFGVHAEADPRTEAGVRQYFSSLDWLGSGAVASPSLSLEAVTCDGLPLIGPLAEAPGVHLACGFAGRVGNFIFEVAERWKRTLLGGADSATNGDGGLGVASPKRFL